MSEMAMIAGTSWNDTIVVGIILDFFYGSVFCTKSAGEIMKMVRCALFFAVRKQKEFSTVSL